MYDDEDAMKPTDFHIGMRFYNPTGHWECTDVGSRTIIAIRLDAPDESWYIGPTYAVAELVMDEDDLMVCERTYEEAYAAYGESFARDCRRKAQIHGMPLDLTKDIYTVPRVKTEQLSPKLLACFHPKIAFLRTLVAQA